MTELMGHSDPDDETFDPRYEAHRLRLTGMPWKQVAARTGYMNETTCMLAVKGYLQSAALTLSNQQKAEALATEIARLDELQSAWWQSALLQDEKAANVVLKIIAQRSRLLGLEVDEKAEQTGNKTILVMGGTREYTKALKNLAGVDAELDNQGDEPEDGVKPNSGKV